jgi:lipopolysaccharide export system permease protein
MTFALTLGLYVSRRFLGATVAMLFSLSGLVSLFDFIELLRRAANNPAVTLGLITEIAALRLPYIAMRLLPFAVLLGGILAFWRLTRSSELIVARASGVSAWEFLAGPVLCAVLLGGIATAGVSPLSSSMLARAEQLDNAYLRSSGGPLALQGGKLWLRQSDRELSPTGVAILNARAVQLKGTKLRTGEVTVLRLDGADRLLARIEAKSATLQSGDNGQSGFWVLDEARVIRPDHLPEAPRQVMLATDLTVGRVQDSFAPPGTLSFWALPDFIGLLDRSGFSSIRHRLHFHALLALPLLAGTMVLVAAGFSMRPTRRGGIARMIGSGVAAGFALFVVSKLAEEFGQSGALPVALAAWAPAASGLLFAVALLLHVEDG